jgi:hypothetical protein
MHMKVRLGSKLHVTATCVVCFNLGTDIHKLEILASGACSALLFCSRN